MNRIITKRPSFFLKVVFSLLLIFNFSISIALANSGTTSTIEERIQKYLPEATVGIILKEAKSGNILYQYQADKAFAPASGLKIFTAAAALKTLGPQYRYKTELKIDKNSLKPSKDNINSLTNLYIQFRGDPTLTVEAFKNLLKTTLQEHKIQKISGNIIIDDTFFSPPNYPFGWSWDSLPWYFSPPITAVMLNENKIKLRVVSNKSIGGKADIQFPEEESLRIPLTTEVISVTQEVADKECSIHVTMDNKNNHTTIKGCWPKAEEPEKFKLAIQNPINIVENVIVETLNDLKMDWSKKIKIGRTPNNVGTLQSLSSEPLSEILKPLLLDSNNIYAESLFKTMGAAKLGQGSFHAGIETMKTVLSKDFNLKPDTFRIEDGSGASRYTVITPQQMGEVLSGIYNSTLLKPIIWDALPVWGVTGTLKKRIQDGESKDHELAGRVHAKTGNMIGVTTLSGYLSRKKGDDLIFVIMINNTLAKADIIHQFQEELLKEWLDY